MLATEVDIVTRINVVSAPKTATFQMRINPEVKAEAEKVFSRCGLTFTDAVNVFIQQSLNVGGLPFIVSSDSREALRNQAIAVLRTEIQKGRDSVHSDSDWVSEEEMLSHFGVNL
jgi:addiction module RelB/DinJ family antitoxin